MTNKTIRYCSLTTVSASMRAFVMPAMTCLQQHGYTITVSCKQDTEFAAGLPESISYIPLDIDRGFRLGKTIKTICHLWRVFRKDRFDMIEYGTENVSFCAAIAGWLARVPVRLYNHWGARYVGYTGFERTISWLIEKMAALFSTDVRQVSQKNMEQCIQDGVYPAAKVKVLGKGGTVGVDFNKFSISDKSAYRKEIRDRFHIPEDAFVWGDIGYIRKDKGSGELIKAFRRLAEEDETVWLLLVGDLYADDLPDADLLQWARQNQRVIFTGRVGDVERYAACMDCLVHPSYREGFGMVLQEAGAMGVPAVTSNIPGPSEFVNNGVTGLLVQPADDVDLFEKMRWLRQHPQEREQMAQAVYRDVQTHFERQVMVNRIVQDRDDLCGRNNGND